MVFIFLKISKPSLIEPHSPNPHTAIHIIILATGQLDNGNKIIMSYNILFFCGFGCFYFIERAIRFKIKANKDVRVRGTIL